MNHLNPNVRKSQRIWRGLAWALGICLALVIVIKILEYPADRHRRLTKEAAETIRAIAKTPVVDFFDDDSQIPDVTVYLEGMKRSEPARYIGRGFYHPKTLRFMVGFRTEAAPGLPYGSPHEMSVDDFAREVERRARKMAHQPSVVPKA